MEENTASEDDLAKRLGEFRDRLESIQDKLEESVGPQAEAEVLAGIEETLDHLSAVGEELPVSGDAEEMPHPDASDRPDHPDIHRGQGKNREPSRGEDVADLIQRVEVLEDRIDKEEQIDDTGRLDQHQIVGREAQHIVDAIEDLATAIHTLSQHVQPDPASFENIETRIESLENSLESVEMQVEELREEEDDRATGSDASFPGTVSIEGQEISVQEAIERFKQRADAARDVAHESQQRQEELAEDLGEISRELGWLYRNTVEVNLMLDILRAVRQSFADTEDLDESAVRMIHHIADRIVEIRASMDRSDRDAGTGRDPITAEQESEVERLGARLADPTE